jgi:hypothetical protein
MKNKYKIKNKIKKKIYILNLLFFIFKKKRNINNYYNNLILQIYLS